MSGPSESELQSWRDPDDLLTALYELGRRPLSAPGAGVREAVDALTDHDDADVRQEALRLLLIGWKAAEYRKKAVEALRFDPEEEVRATAALGLAATSTDSTRLEDAALLLDLLFDNEQPVTLRGAAYEALLILYRKPQFPPMTRDFIPGEDVDWEWVHQLRAEIRPSR